MRRTLALIPIALVLALAGCGSDNSGETTAPTVSIPPITSPIPATTTAPTTAVTPTGTGTASNGNGGVGPSGKPNPNKPDSETNDVQPPAGSPQSAFEKQCQQNPQACG